jgi:hypothetical protein
LSQTSFGETKKAFFIDCTIHYINYFKKKQFLLVTILQKQNTQKENLNMKINETVIVKKNKILNMIKTII